jgi:hypothetical protein
MAMVKLSIVLLAGCVTGLDAPGAPSNLDRGYFRCNVQPVLATRCAFPACHGTQKRPLSIYSPGRQRYQVGWDRPTEPITAYELDANYGIAGGFTTANATGVAWLLAKPLATEAGGYYHRGQNLYGTDNVFLSKDDKGYRILASWIAGQAAPASCQPITEVGP